jgi:hypothetical protein
MLARLSTSKTGLRTNTPMATGTLMRKIHSQPRPDVIGPPTTHAAVAAVAPVAVQIPIALLRSEPSANVVMRIAIAAGVISADATP